MESKSVTLLEDLCASPESATHSPLESLPPSIANTSADLADLCWVARAVYGESNPQWLEFRAWLLADAPAWFRGLYTRHGRRVARWIAPHQRVKSVIRRWMDSIIASR